MICFTIIIYLLSFINYNECFPKQHYLFQVHWVLSQLITAPLKFQTAKLQNKILIRFIVGVDKEKVHSVSGNFKKAGCFPAQVSFNVRIFEWDDDFVVDINHAKTIVLRGDDHRMVEVVAFQNMNILILRIDSVVAIIFRILESGILNYAIKTILQICMEKLFSVIGTAFSEVAVFKSIYFVSTLINAVIRLVFPD